MTNFRPPEKLNFRDPQWEAWRSSFQSYRVVTNLDQESDEVQVATLKYSMGPDSEDVFRKLGVQDASKMTYEKILSLLDSYFKPKKNVIKLRNDFQNQIRKPGENIEIYQENLIKAAKECMFGNTEERIRDQFVFGVQNNDLCEGLENLYMTNPNDFTLEKVVAFSNEFVARNSISYSKSGKGNCSETKTQSMLENKTGSSSHKYSPSAKGNHKCVQNKSQAMQNKESKSNSCFSSYQQVLAGREFINNQEQFLSGKKLSNNPPKILNDEELSKNYEKLLKNKKLLEYQIKVLKDDQLTSTGHTFQSSDPQYMKNKQ